MRIQLLHQLNEAGRLYPSMRFGQLLCFICSIADETGPGTVQGVGDETALSTLLGHLVKHAGQREGENNGLVDTPLIRTHLVRTLETLSHRCPEWTLGQLFFRLAALAHVNIYDIEDDVLLETARSTDPGIVWFYHYVDVFEQKSTVCGPGEGTVYPCPCCHYLTLSERGGFEICPVCFWEDDGQDDADAVAIRGGPNGALSLQQARENYRRMGASDPKFQDNVRPPLRREQQLLAAETSNSSGS
ncbi:MAG: hypothetical protein K2R98_02980 [Gemmataceae bacterium]|nr:hypothetical protein [Gemmataceae bacterium]